MMGERMRYEDVEIPEYEDLLEAVRILKRLFPDDPIEVIDRGALESAVEGTKKMLYYLPFQKSEEKAIAAASKLLYELSMLHPLSDGNKRLASFVCLSVLEANGWKLPRRGTKAYSALLYMVYHAVTVVVKSARDWEDVFDGFKSLAGSIRDYMEKRYADSIIKYVRSLQLFES